MEHDSELARAAQAYGIEPEYIDIWGRVHETPDDVAGAILASLGATGLAEALECKALEHWSHPLDPALVVRQDEEAIALRIPSGRAGDSVKLEIRWESGELEHHWFWLPELPTVESARTGDREWLAKRVPLPRPLRLGYHDLKVYWMQEPELESFGETRFIVCPARAASIDRRVAGLALSLYGLRSSRNWGVGDFTDLRAVIDAFAPAGVAFLALNPLHAIANRQPYNTSPYLPQSSLYRNFIYLDVDKIGESQANIHEIQALRDSEFIEYERVAQLKLAALKKIFENFPGSPEFDRFVESEGAALHDFAVYCALDEEMHRLHPDIWVWTDWPEPYRYPQLPAVVHFAKEHKRSVLFYKFLQWHISRQLAETQAYALEKGMSIGLYHDLALATDRFGADLWAHRSFYVAGCRVGSPPDDFSPNGQDWAFPPPDRDAHRRDGYHLFTEAIRKNARHGGALRIDHVMRFFRLYWIPDAMPATRGAYVRDYARDLLGIVALESVRGNFLVVGEDLGTVTGEVRHALAESGILSYRLFWFEKNPDGSFRAPGEYPAQAAVSTTTHDLPTLAGFTAARDIEARKQAGLIGEDAYDRQLATRDQEKAKLAEALRNAGFENDPLGFLLSAPSVLAIVNQEDLTGEIEQQNLPGSTWQHPNWRRKMKVAVEDLQPLARDLGEKIARSGRR